MDAEAFRRVMEAGQLTWEQLNPISYVYYPTAEIKPESKVILKKSTELDNRQGLTITGLMMTLKHGNRDYIMAGTRVSIPVSDFGPTELFWYGSEPVLFDINDVEIVVEMPTVTQIVALYIKNGEISTHLYYS